MRGRLAGLEFHRFLQLRQRLAIALLLSQDHAEPQMCVRIRRIAGDGAPVRCFGLSCVFVTARDFTQIEIRQTMATAFRFGFEPGARLFGILLAPVEITDGKAGVRNRRVFLDCPAILGDRFLRLLLAFIRRTQQKMRPCGIRETAIDLPEASLACALFPVSR